MTGELFQFQLKKALTRPILVQVKRVKVKGKISATDILLDKLSHMTYYSSQ
jgi:hypothetical protein